VIGVEKMNALDNAGVAAALAAASYMQEEGATGLTFPGIFAQMAQQYFERYGDQSDALATIAAKNHANGARNPLAHIRRRTSWWRHRSRCRTARRWPTAPRR
jgi:acetyl-CoA C-acetyltransferase